jgi:hypothetical protein
MSRPPRTFDLLRTPRTAAPADAISEDLYVTFTSAAGRRVMQWLFEQHVISQLPTNAEDCAFREAEGKKRLVLELINKIEDFTLVSDRPSERPNTRPGSAR